MKRILFVLALASCADARDVFAPYQPNAAEIDALLQKPRAAHYDAALVLGCPAEPDGSPSLCERCRVKSAVRLYKRGVVDKLVFSGGAAHSPWTEADVMGDLAVRRGVPSDKVIREGRALTTWQNVRFAKSLLDEAKVRSTLVISTADHLPRAQRIMCFWGAENEATGYFAWDRDPPPDSEAEWALPQASTPRLAD